MIDEAIEKYFEGLLSSDQVSKMKLRDEPVYPAIVFMERTSTPSMDTDGHDSLTVSRFDLSLWGDPLEIKETEPLIRKLHGFRGDFCGVKVHLIESEKLQADLHDEKIKKRRVIFQLTIHYEEVII